MGKTQKTPQGHEIPVPTKDDVFKVLEKAEVERLRRERQ